MPNVSIAWAPWPRAQGPGPMARGPGPRPRGPWHRAQGSGPMVHRFFKTTYGARIRIEGARFPPFGFAIAEISSNSNEYVSFCQKDLLCPDSGRGCSVSPLRVRHYNLDLPISLGQIFCPRLLLTAPFWGQLRRQTNWFQMRGRRGFQGAW